MASTFYIDANRNNSSIKNNDNKNEWEYKLSNPIMLPAGTQVSVLDTFVNKKGIGGQTIEIEEDFEEVINYTYYLSDNPHFVPSGEYDANTNQQNTNFQKLFKNTFIPFGPLFQLTADGYTIMNSQTPTDNKPNRGFNILYGEPIPNQKLAMLRPNADGLPFYNYAGVSQICDPYLYGCSEQPMFACRVSQVTAPTQAAYPPVTDPYFTDYHGPQATGPDKYLEPIIGQSTIFIPKGVYSVEEIADLIEGQLNGKYTNLKNNDLSSDFISDKENTGDYDGGFDNGGFYTKFNAMSMYGNPDYRWGGVPGVFVGDIMNNNFQESPMVPSFTRIRAQSNIGIVPYVAPHPNNDGSGTMNPGNGKPPINPQRQGGTNWPPATTANNDIPDETIAFFLPTYNFHKLADFWKYERDYLSFKRNPTEYKTGGLAACPYKSTNEFIDTNFRYGLQHLQSRGGSNNLLLFKEHYKPADDTSADHSKIFADAAPVNFAADLGSQTFLPIGLHVKRKINFFPYWSELTDTHAHPSADGYSYYGGIPTGGGGVGFQYGDNFQVSASVQAGNADVMKEGYYLGTPDFTFTYDSDKSAFSISNLHQNKRIPSSDQWGNKMANEGTACCNVKRVAEGVAASIPPRQDQHGNTPPEYFAANEQLRNALKTPETRVGGVAVFNWAYQTALKYGDLKITDTSIPQFFNTELNADRPNSNRQHIPIYRENDKTEVEYPTVLKGRKLFKFEEFFSTKEKALEAWNKTLWSKLGFSFENLQDSSNWERTKYYDIPNNNSDPNAVETFGRYGLIENDFITYGKTTRADLGASVAPTISTTNQPALYTVLRTPAGGAPAGGDGISVRTYDNHDTVHTWNTLTSAPYMGGVIPQPTNGIDSSYKYYINSTYRGATLTPVNTESRQILANTLPSLSNNGYYLITSDIIDNWRDDLKQNSPLPLLGVVPISNLSNQDFITTKNELVHTTSQPKVINSIKIKILKPDLTAPILEDGSSVILSITTPLPQQTPLQGDQTDAGNEDEDKKKHPQPDPADKK